MRQPWPDWLTDLADEIDRAQAYDEFFRRISLNAHTAASATGALGLSRTECAECGEEIPAARRRAMPGCSRCIACQTEYERSQKC